MNKLLEHRVAQVGKDKQSRNKWASPETYLWVLNPWARTAHWAGVVFVGVSSSLHSDKILDFVFPIVSETDGINWYSTTFFTLFILLAGWFALHDWVKRKQDNYAIDAMLTMPPRDFWLSYGMNYTALASQNDSMAFILEDAIEEDNGSGTKNLKEAIEEAKKEVRIGLDQIIRLAKKWDSANLDNASITYRANVMKVFYIRHEGIKPDCDLEFIAKDSEQYTVLAKLSLPFATAPIQHKYSGFVALLENDYTTSTLRTEPEPDLQRKPIAFPFTLNSDTRESLVRYNHPGASKAIESKAPSYIADVKTLPEQYIKQESTDNVFFEKRVYDSLVDYYSNNKVAHSMLSIPLSDNSERVEYVLNVYRDQDQMLYAGGKVADFSEIVRPYAAIIERMIGTIEVYERKLS